MFALEKSNREVEAAFQATRKVLQKLGTYSAQAVRYSDILGHLGSVVTKKRAERASQTGTRGGHIVKMINFGSGIETSPLLSTGEDDFAAHPLFNLDDPGLGFGSINNLLFSMQDDLVNYDDILLGWNQAASQL
jgi:hypothetical protein